MRVTLVHNPNSGDDDHERDYLIGMISRAGHRVAYHTSKEPWLAALDPMPDLIAVAGGDGTVAKVVRAVANRSIPVTILPMGTANNVAGWLGLSGIPFDELVAGWSAGKLQPFDMGIARGPWGMHRFLESVGFGVLAGLMDEIDSGSSTHVNELDSREARVAAALGVLESLLGKAAPVRCELTLDDVVFAGDYLLVEVLNFGAAGPNLHLAPTADGADGMLDVVVIEAHERAWLEHHLAMVRAEPDSAPRLPVHHARRVTIRCQRCLVHVDDELWSGKEEGRFTVEAFVESAALRFLVPPVAQHVVGHSRSA